MAVFPSARSSIVESKRPPLSEVLKCAERGGGDRSQGADPDLAKYAERLAQKLKAKLQPE